MDIDVILDARADAGQLAELGGLAERVGIRGVWVSSLLDSRDPFTNLVVLARSTKKILLGPVAVNPYDIHPVRIASSFLTLNELADGRARLVIGGGGEALEALGIQPKRRVRVVRECVDIIKAAASGEPVHYSGEIFQVNNLRLAWLEAPTPPVYIGASMEQMLRMAAKTADGIMMSDMPVALAARAIATLDKSLVVTEKTRPEFTTNAFAAWHVYPDRKQAVREAKQWLVLRGIFRSWLLREFLAESDVELVMSRRDEFWHAFSERSDCIEGVPDAVLDALIENITLTGTPDQLDQKIEKLHAYEAVGLNAIALRLYHDPAASIRLLGERVVPALR
jgi:5,10-methylenetetrahydromethanopterin reductase